MSGAAEPDQRSNSGILASYVFSDKANLNKFDNSNGVDVELQWGDEVAVDQFVMTQIADGVWTCTRQ